MFTKFVDEKWQMFKERPDGHLEKVLEVPSESTSAEFLSVPFGDVLYLWRKEYSICGSSLAYMRYFFSKVTISNETGVYGISDLSPPIDSDPEAGDYPSEGHSTLVNISTDGRSISFSHVVDQNEDLGNCTEDTWHNKPECAILTYDVPRDSWSEDGSCQVRYPYADTRGDSSSEDSSSEDSSSEDEAGEKTYPSKGLTTSSKTVKPKAKIYATQYPIVPPCKRLAVADFEERTYSSGGVQRHYPESSVGALYYMKTTSPYNTTMWRLHMDKERWDIITHLPSSLDRFQHFQPAMAPSDWLTALPDSKFIDVAVDIGESALARLEWSAASVNMDFSEILLTQELYEQELRKSWHNRIK